MNHTLHRLLTIIGTILVISHLHALTYTISFTGSGASSSVNSVVVQNLTKGTSATVNAGATLILSDLNTDVNSITNSNGITVQPTNATGLYNVTFVAPQSGEALISTYKSDGRKSVSEKFILSEGTNSFFVQMSGEINILKIEGQGFTLSKKVLTNTAGEFKASIYGLNNTSQSARKSSKSSAVLVTNMAYNTGDLLLFKGVSGNYSTIITDIPTSSKTINFQFVECKDADNNYYPVVKIGNQLWMAENLKSSKFRTGDNITEVSSATVWASASTSAYVNYNFSSANSTSYGKLYNWYAVSDSKNLSPTGWRIPSESDWTTLATTLGGEAGTGDKIKLSGIDFWGIGNTGTNSSGFSAIPSGFCSSTGSFYYIGTNALWWTSSIGTDTSKGIYEMCSSTTSALAKNEYSQKGGLSVRCIKSDLATVATTAATLIMSKSFNSGGTISSTGGEAITSCGVCWNTTGTPTILDNKTTSTLSNNSFSASVTGLTPNTTYYVRAYATNGVGTSYGNTVSVSTPLVDPIMDADGNIYQSVTIGNQTWLTENLKTTRYRNGDLIGTTSSVYQSVEYETSPKYQWAYEGNESYVSTYGRYYTWFVINDSRNIAPTGWHVATEPEWATLQNYLVANGFNYDQTTTDNKIAKSLCSKNLWNSTSATGTPGYLPNLNNTTGFTMTPTGYRGKDGNYYSMGVLSDIWTATETGTSTANARGCGYNVLPLNSFSLNKNYGFVVRCVKNSTPLVTSSAASSVLTTSAVCGGNVTADGGDTVTEYGVCWSTTTNPTISNSKKAVGTGTGTFSTTITGLNAVTTYYIRAYATNSLGTSYGEQITITTQLP